MKSFNFQWDLMAKISTNNGLSADCGLGSLWWILFYRPFQETFANVCILQMLLFICVTWHLMFQWTRQLSFGSSERLIGTIFECGITTKWKYVMFKYWALMRHVVS